MTPLPDEPSDRCPTCGKAAMLAYCGACGEKRPERSDWKLQNIAAEAFAEITNLEHSKVWQTLRLLVFKPGQLTREYWSGRRKMFLGPVKLYLIFFALSLVLYSIHQPTAVYDVRTLATADPAGRLARQVGLIASNTGVPSAFVAQEINSRWQTYISWSQLLYPLIVAVTLKLLFFRLGRYFAEHLIFSLHLLAFTFFSSLVLWPAYFFSGVRDLSTELFSGAYLALTAASIVWVTVYLSVAVRRAYNESWPAAVAKGVAVFVAYFAISSACLAVALLLAIRLVSGASG